MDLSVILAEETEDYADVTDREFGGACVKRLFVGEIIGRLTRSLPLSRPEGPPSMSLASPRLHSVKHRLVNQHPPQRTPYNILEPRLNEAPLAAFPRPARPTAICLAQASAEWVALRACAMAPVK